jgi:hypothetical protein
MDLLLGESAPNSTYLGQRLLYRAPEPSFDPITNAKYFSEVGKHLKMYGAIWFLGGFFSLIVFLVLLLLTRSFGVLELWGVGGMLVGLILAGVFVFRAIPVQLSEWKFSVDGKAAVASTALGHISWSLKTRGSPIPSQRVRRISQPGVPTRDYLELRDKIFAGYISCFPYGEDLYIGWTFWLSLSPFQWGLTAIGRIYQSLTLRVNELYISLRYESAQAMREAMHSAAREGIDVAIGYLPAQGQGTIGSDVPVDVTTFTI